MDSTAVWELDDALKKQDGDARRISPGTVSDVDEQGVIWVRLVGSDEDTPVTSSTASVDKGDVVNVRIEGGRAWIDGSTSNPSASTSDLGNVNAKAIQALQDAAMAALAASDAKTSAGIAAEAAHDAVESAASAEQAAAEAWEKADSAETAAAIAQQSAESAQADAATAHEAADSAKTDAQTAFDAARSAQADAHDAYNASLIANNAATGALAQLSTVEDVIGVIDWAQEHATYELTDDTEVEQGKIYWQQVEGYVVTTDSQVDQAKTYYELTGDGSEEHPFEYVAVTPVGDENPSELGWYEHVVTGYDPVTNPTAEGLSGYYEMNIVDALGNYVRSHLALTEAGLYLLKDDSGYKTLLTNEDMRVIDPTGNVVASFGESVTFSPERSHYIGSEDAFILFTPAQEGGHGSITIGGEHVEFSNDTTLSELLESVSGLGADVSTLNDMSSELNGRMAGAEDSIASLDDDVNGIAADVGTMGVQLDDVRSRVIIGNIDVGGSEVPAITLNASGSAAATFEAVLTNQSLTFRDNGQDVAWISNQELNITSATVTDTLRFGSFAFIPRSNGNLALKWLGGN